jgi:hypothetical protein
MQVFRFEFSDSYGYGYALVAAASLVEATNFIKAHNEDYGLIPKFAYIIDHLTFDNGNTHPVIIIEDWTTKD